MLMLVIVFNVSISAFGVTVSALPQSEYADTEVSTNIAFAVERPAMTRIEFTVALDATPTNNVEVAIGTDANISRIPERTFCRTASEVHVSDDSIRRIAASNPGPTGVAPTCGTLHEISSPRQRFSRRRIQ